MNSCCEKLAAQAKAAVIIARDHGAAVADIARAAGVARLQLTILISKKEMISKGSVRRHNLNDDQLNFIIFCSINELNRISRIARDGVSEIKDLAYKKLIE